jgi:hypothetical protein
VWHGDVAIQAADIEPVRSDRLDTVITAVRQVVLVGLAILFYFLVRGLTEGDPTLAERNATSLVRLEQRLRVHWEPTLHRFTVAHGPVRTLANWIYIWGHWPVIIPCLVWLYRRQPERYGRLRNACFVSGAIGLVIFASYPVAPPRLTPEGFVDTVTRWSHSYRVLQPPALVNRYAALPSLHAGWNLLLGLVMFRATRRRVVRVLAVTLPVLMATAVVATANHFVLDVVAGAVLSLVGLLAANHLADLGQRHPFLARLTPGVSAGSAADRSDPPVRPAGRRRR